MMDGSYIYIYPFGWMKNYEDGIYIYIYFMMVGWFVLGIVPSLAQTSLVWDSDSQRLGG